MSESESYIGQAPCGCLVMAAVNNPEHRNDVAKAVARAIREGLRVSLVPTQQVREMPWQCEHHAKKEKGSQRALVIEKK